MKFSLALALLTLFMSVVSLKADPNSKPTEKPDPIVGKWRYFNGQIITLSDDGHAASSIGSTGTWKFVESPEVERKYTITFKEGLYVDEMVLSANGKRLTGKNVAKMRIWADRVGP
jgi:hypothetical protein